MKNRIKIIILIILVFFFMLNEAGAKPPTIIPSKIDVGSINPSLDFYQESEGIYTVLWTGDNDQQSGVIKVLLTQPLGRTSDGFPLPLDRIKIKRDAFVTLTTKKPMLLSLSDENKLELEFKIKTDRFDPPGNYEAVISLWEESSPEDEKTELLIKLKIEGWVQMKLATADSTLTANGIEPGPDSYLSNGKETLIYVASNTDWLLGAYMETGFHSDNSYDYIIPKEDLMIRTFSNDWLQPVFEDFIGMVAQPVVLALGKSTGNCADGWIPVRGEQRLPYNRSQVAGNYSGEVYFIAVPENMNKFNIQF